MPSVATAGAPTRLAVFDALVAVAKARVVALAEERTMTDDDAEFLLRALIDLESDGVDLFGRGRPADAAFYAGVTEYLVARVGPAAAIAPLLAPVEQLLDRREPLPGRSVDRAVQKLITHQGGRA